VVELDHSPLCPRAVAVLPKHLLAVNTGHLMNFSNRDQIGLLDGTLIGRIGTTRAEFATTGELEWVRNAPLDH
jgi:hypothetical protein